MSLIRWIVSLTILSAWCALIGTGLYVAIYEPPSETPSGQAIIVLGGAAGSDGALSGHTAERVAHAVALYEAGSAELVVVTGGGTPPVARDMAAEAVEAGIPETALLVEDASHSTLQNALFTADLAELDKGAPIVLVTQRFHLPRAIASFRWAGFTDVIGSAADAGQGFEVTQGFLLEAVKWPFNILRAGAASVAQAGDVPRESYIQYLE